MGNGCALGSPKRANSNFNRTCERHIRLVLALAAPPLRPASAARSGLFLKLPPLTIPPWRPASAARLGSCLKLPLLARPPLRPASAARAGSCLKLPPLFCPPLRPADAARSGLAAKPFVDGFLLSVMVSVLNELIGGRIMLAFCVKIHKSGPAPPKCIQCAPRKPFWSASRQ